MGLIWDLGFRVIDWRLVGFIWDFLRLIRLFSDPLGLIGTLLALFGISTDLCLLIFTGISSDLLGLAGVPTTVLIYILSDLSVFHYTY